MSAVPVELPAAGPPGGWLDQARPALRPGVRIGPALSEGTREVHVVGEPLTTAYLRVGEREAFLIGRLDGRASLSEIGEAYAARFGRRLAESNRSQLLGLLHRHALVEPADPGRIAQLRAATEARRRIAGRNLLHYRLPVPGLIRVLTASARYAGWVLHPVAVVAVCLAGVLGFGVLLTDAGAVVAAGRTPQSWTTSVAAIVAMWALIGVHEFAHGLACLRYGGRPSEIGVLWRAPVLAAYCKVDDTVTFERGQRVMTSFAGVYIHIAALAPLALLWRMAEPGGWLRGTVALIAVTNVVTIVINLIPVLHLDGYHMLEHGLGCLRLQSQAFIYIGSKVKSSYPARARRIYTGYVALVVAIVVPTLGALVTLWYRTLAPLVGALGAVAILASEAVVLVVAFRWALRRRAQRLAALSEA